MHTSYEPAVCPEARTAPEITESLMTVYGVRLMLEPSFTAETCELPVPAQKPVPVMEIVAASVVLPIFGVTVLTAGGFVVTTYCPAAEVAFVSPAAVIMTSYVPAGTPAGTTAVDMVVLLVTLNGVTAVPPLRVIDETDAVGLPPKKLVPVTEIVVVPRFEPVAGFSAVIVGKNIWYIPISQGTRRVFPS